MTEETGKTIHVPEPRGPNRDERRDGKKRAVELLKKSRRFVLVTFDGGPGLPNYIFDVYGMDPKKDIRARYMVSMASAAANGYDIMRGAVEKVSAEMLQSDKVENEKARLAGKTGEVAEEKAA